MPQVLRHRLGARLLRAAALSASLLCSAALVHAQSPHQGHEGHEGHEGHGVPGQEGTAAQLDEHRVPVAGPQDVSFPTEDSLTVDATYFPTPTTTPPAVILVHGLAQDRSVWDRFARELTDHGIAVLAVNLRTVGAGTNGQAPRQESSDDSLMAGLANDIRAGIRFLREREDIDGVRVAVIGASIGANAAAGYATDDYLLVGLGLLSPTIESRGFRTDEAIHAFGKRPSIVIAAKNDQTSVHALPILQEKAQGEMKLLRADGGAHGTDLLEQFSVRAAILEWLDGIFKTP